MFYYLYEVRNVLNNKIYVGVHKTEDLEDGYMGSGTVLQEDIKKYGVENFQKSVLEYFSSSKDMYQRESEVVNSKFLLREDVYNVLPGVHGGFDWINSTGIPKMKGKKHTEQTKKILSEKMTGRNHPNSWICKDNRTEEQDEKFKEMASKGGKSLKEKSKSEEHKAKIAEGVRRRLEKDPEILNRHKEAMKAYHLRKKESLSQ